MADRPRPDALVDGIPSLSRWLGDGRADGFEEWVSLSFGPDREATSPEQARALRIMQTFGIACIEQMRREREIAGDAPGADAEAIAMWARGCGYVTMCAVASILRDDTPWRRLAKVLTEEFKTGAGMAAAALAGSRAAS